jgi:hypothetical protein
VLKRIGFLRIDLRPQAAALKELGDTAETAYNIHIRLRMIIKPLYHK